MYQVHVTLKKHPGSKLKVPDTKVHVICNLLPDGQWRKEWITTTNIERTERDAVKVMRDIASSMAKIGVTRQKIEVPVKKLQGDRQVLYVEAHIKLLLSLPNLDRALNMGLNVSVNAEKPGSMMLTFRRKRYKEVVEECKAAELEKFLGFDPARPIRYEAAIIDSNPDADNDWIKPYGK